MEWVVSIVDVGSFAGMLTGLLAGVYGHLVFTSHPRDAQVCMVCHLFFAAKQKQYGELILETGE